MSLTVFDLVAILHCSVRSVSLSRCCITKGSCMDEELASEQIRVERKLLSFSLNENQRGRFIRITEDVGGHRDTVIIPATGLQAVRDVLDRLIEQNRA